mmetsp:Transcript_30999/g.51386  ORF Transcript_30999/g.51386 Transcript_30999/m.51386 type:complete len:277 (+) Transcript_30999:33-863(+)
MATQAKLLAALRKNADDENDTPRLPGPASEPVADQGVLKLRKSNLLGTVTWEQALEKLDLNGKHDHAECTATIAKMFGNVLANPSEPKYRKIRLANPNFSAKVYSCSGAPEIFRLAGFKDTVEQGFLLLPATADISLLQCALDEIAKQIAARSEAEEKKRKKEHERAVQAREARSAKKREESEPARFDAAVAGASSMMVDEDEVMIAAIEAFMDAHPDLKKGRNLDTYAIERQAPGPADTVVATVTASERTNYYDYHAFMKRSKHGEWSVQKIEIA